MPKAPKLRIRPRGRVGVVEHAAGGVTAGGFDEVGEPLAAPVMREGAARLEGAAGRQGGEVAVL